MQSTVLLRPKHRPQQLRIPSGSGDKRMQCHLLIYIYICTYMLHVDMMIHILNLLLAIDVFIICFCKINNVEPRVWALSPPLLCYSI